MDAVDFRVLTTIGTVVSCGTVGLYSYHANFFARRWKESKTARLMATLFMLSALNACIDAIYSVMLALGAQATALNHALYPLWLFVLVCTAMLLHKMVGHFDLIIESQRDNGLRGGAKWWCD